MQTDTRVPRLMHVPPPLLFVATFLLGLGLQHLLPLSIRSPGVLRAAELFGLALLVCGVLLALAAIGMFIAARTTIIPFGSASRLVTHGPFRLTRNPMYVSLTLVYLGAAGLLAAPWPLLLLILPVAFVNGIVIPFEEARLRSVFGDSYLEYCSRVRRWL